jgi:hypothetical protein
MWGCVLITVSYSTMQVCISEGCLTSHWNKWNTNISKNTNKGNSIDGNVSALNDTQEHANNKDDTC